MPLRWSWQLIVEIFAMMINIIHGNLYYKMRMDDGKFFGFVRFIVAREHTHTHTMLLFLSLWLLVISTLPANQQSEHHIIILHNAFVSGICVCACAFSTASTLFWCSVAHKKICSFIGVPIEQITNNEQKKQQPIKSMRKDYSLELTFWLEWQRWCMMMTEAEEKKRKNIPPCFELEVIIIVMFIALFIGIYYDLLIICGLIWTLEHIAHTHTHSRIKSCKQAIAIWCDLVVWWEHTNTHEMPPPPNHDMKSSFHCTTLCTRLHTHIHRERERKRDILSIAVCNMYWVSDVFQV